MKRLFQKLPKVSGAAKPRPIVDSAHVARLLIFGFLTATRLFLITPAMATSVVALIDNANHRVVIAADCRVNRQFASHSECKIIEAPDCTAAIAGLYQENGTAFKSAETRGCCMSISRRSTGEGGSILAIVQETLRSCSPSHSSNRSK